MKRILVFIFLLLLVGCTDRANAFDFHAEKQWMEEMKQPLPAYFLPKTLNIVALGDSLTQGVGDESARGGYVFYLEQYLTELKGVKDVQIDNFGVKGHRSDQLLSRLNKEEIKTKIEQADLVLMTIGGNDIMKVVKENIFHLKMEDFQARQEIFETNLKNIFDLIKEYNSESTIFLIGLYNPFSYWFSDIPQLQEIVQNWNETGKQVTSLYEQSYFVPIDEIFSTDRLDLLYEDQFHPNGRGYELIAQTVFSFLQNEVVTDENNEWFLEREDE
ncbi:SGNH/GDSL hydrolase family protein [Fervidibacillus halotolerans]|uniref:SGNH/GDSL hydrolase family protein n=1 Tax=Fervidibacillus halotolerans TaxID=2980027 RepID=A0A9E8M161_9BACI|nr:SGNH/GDSL hydrolase family protein [Fervidibacillus halotolerans]WAA13281.1 SGNH/GDSL hydrolase family protein [Fervidibacillus halotolerans]